MSDREFLKIDDSITLRNLDHLHKAKSTGIIVMPMTVGNLIPYLTAIVGCGNRLRELGFQMDLLIGGAAQGVRDVNTVFLSTGAEHGLQNNVEAAHRDCNAVAQTEFEFAVAGKQAPHYHPFFMIPGENGYDGHGWCSKAGRDRDSDQRFERPLRNLLSTPHKPHGKRPVETTVYDAPEVLEFRIVCSWLTARNAGKALRMDRKATLPGSQEPLGRDSACIPPPALGRRA